MTSRIFLGKKQIALVDDEDSDLIPRHPWKVIKNSTSSDHEVDYFFVGANGTRGIWILRRVIMERVLNRPLTKDELVIHKDGNFLNCVRNNLEIISHLQQARRKNKQHKKAGSEYKGVYFDKKMNKWCTRIRTTETRKIIGYYESEVDAAIAYNAAAIELFGIDARLNKISMEA